MSNLPEQVETEKSAGIFPSDGPLPPPMPYTAFADSLAPADLRPIPPAQALREDPEIGAFLKHGPAGSGGTGKRALRGVLGLVLCGLALFAAAHFHQWTMLRTYAPATVSATPKPLPYPDDPPLEFLEPVKAINADILAGDRWGPAFDRMKALRKEIAAAPKAAPDALKLWLDTEMLVTMASKEVPPESDGDTASDALFTDIADLTRNKGPVPIRAGFAYVRLLHTAAGREDLSREGDGLLLGVLELLRGEHAFEMDRTPDILAIEAAANIGALPGKYRENDRYLDFHWRRASHAIARLYQIAAPGDKLHIELDRMRWEKVYSYFDFTILTLSYSKFGRIRKVTLDGEEYTMERVKENLDRLGRLG